jgi:hypothetical protein
MVDYQQDCAPLQGRYMGDAWIGFSCVWCASDVDVIPTNYASVVWFRKQTDGLCVASYVSESANQHRLRPQFSLLSQHIWNLFTHCLHTCRRRAQTVYCVKRFLL